jgi:hypothetical protein
LSDVALGLFHFSKFFFQTFIHCGLGSFILGIAIKGLERGPGSLALRVEIATLLK